MGRIKEGCISGFLPSNSNSFVVHYPGYPSSTERAVETLGGTDAILKARSLQSNKLELHFRPEDPYSHPAFGELLPCNNFLLKISKHNGGHGQIGDDSNRLSHSSFTNSASPEQNIACSVLTVNAHGVSQLETESIAVSAKGDAEISKEVEENIFADIVARVSEAYRFNGMVDYQHVLAVHADVARRKKRKWVDVEPQFEKRGLIDVDQEDLMILVPPLFSPKDIPERIVLKPSIDVSLKKKQEGAVQHRWEMEIEPSLAIDFNIKEIPKKVNWEKYIPQDSDQYEWQMAVCKLFDERPIWIKDSLIERLQDKGLQFGGHMLRRLLFRTAYYFSNGPFLRFWIRKGYDPRKDPESRIFQRTDFRVPPSLRSYCDNHIAPGVKHKWQDLCAFRVFPYKCQTSLQLFELVDDYIQQEIRKPSTQENCSLATGWFSSHVLDSLRLCVAVRFLSIYPKPGAESFLKAASVRFEKSKRTKFLAKEQRNNQEGQQTDQVVIEERQTNDDDDGDEEDEIEDENADDELDETLEMAGEESNFSLQPDAYQENVSKNYLQELFCSFPFSEAVGNEIQDVENSDEEYQIFEELSDGNHSDEDY